MKLPKVLNGLNKGRLMKPISMTASVFFFLLFFITSLLVCVTNAQAVDIGFELSTGLSTSGDYSDSIEKAYEAVYGDSSNSGG